MRTISLTAISLETLYVPIRQTNILKWQIDVTEELRQFVAGVEQALVGVGIKPLYKSGFVSSLVAALREVPKLSEESLTKYSSFPYHLFVGEQIELSKICGSNDFETLAIIPILTSGKSNQPPDPA